MVCFGWYCQGVSLSRTRVLLFILVEPDWRVVVLFAIAKEFLCSFPFLSFPFSSSGIYICKYIFHKCIFVVFMYVSSAYSKPSHKVVNHDPSLLALSLWWMLLLYSILITSLVTSYTTNCGTFQNSVTTNLFCLIFPLSQPFFVCCCQGCQTNGTNRQTRFRKFSKRIY